MVRAVALAAVLRRRLNSAFDARPETFFPDVINDALNGFPDRQTAAITAAIFRARLKRATDARQPRATRDQRSRGTRRDRTTHEVRCLRTLS